MTLTLKQLSFWPDLDVVVVPGEQDEVDDYTPPTEAEWQEMLRPATVEVVSFRKAHGEFHRCGTKLVADKALTDDGVQAILVCFECGVYWRCGHNDQRCMSLVNLIKAAKLYWPQWIVQRQEAGEL